jgi:hypothetical protein
MNPKPGSVQILGLYEGPAESWTPRQDHLVDALRRAGVPTNLLHTSIDGGRAALEPEPSFFPREQFSGEPGEALALALEFLLTETADGQQPHEWFCTLRLVEFHETKRTETLLQVHEDGIRGVTREQPWSPVPEQSLLDLARKQWWVLVLIVIGFTASIWLKRSEIASYYDAMFGTDFVMKESLSVETDGFASYLKVDLDYSEDDHELVLSFEKLQTYPESTAAFDALRSTASMKEAAALSAMELGYAQLELLFDDNFSERERVSLSEWDESGKLEHSFDSSDWQGRTLKEIRLTP